MPIFEGGSVNPFASGTPTFPTLSQKRWSKFFNIEQEDPALRSEMDGGYVLTRARYTRVPRRTYSDGFTYLTETDRVTFMTFYETSMGGSSYFYWQHPTTLASILVRFKDKPQWKYIGAGTNFRWEVTFKVEEV